jgi:hypothetical protein
MSHCTSRGDGLDVFDVLLDRVGVVEAQVALALVLAGDAEVEADGLRVADVQVAVGLGREAGDDLGVAFLRDVARDDVTDEVTGGGRGCGGLGGHSGQRRRNDTADATPQFMRRCRGENRFAFAGCRLTMPFA